MRALASGAAFQAGVLTLVSRALRGPLPSPWEPCETAVPDELMGASVFLWSMAWSLGPVQTAAPTVGPTRPQACSAVVSSVGTSS